PREEHPPTKERAMKWTVRTAMAGVGLLASAALASHIEPASAKKLQLALVNAFFPCTSPSTATQSGNNASACAPAAPFDFCALSPTGSGKITMLVTGDPAAGTQAASSAIPRSQAGAESPSGPSSAVGRRSSSVRSSPAHQSAS